MPYYHSGQTGFVTVIVLLDVNPPSDVVTLIVAVPRVTPFTIPN